MITQSLIVNTEHFLLEVDHIQIYTMVAASAICVLQELGLSNANQTVRRERQGTASTLFFFQNTYLELIWVEDEIAFRQYAAQTNMNLIERWHWQQTGASPFGIGLRSKTNLLNELNNLWINTFQTEWGNLESTINFSAENLGALEEPICFTIPNEFALTTLLNHNQKEHQHLINHPLGIKKLTEVKIVTNTYKTFTNAISLLKDNNIITIERGVSPLLELTFDENRKQEIVDARPILPIILKY